jgi:WD40 repeat protein
LQHDPLASTTFWAVVSGNARGVRWFVRISLCAFALLLASAGSNAQVSPSFFAQVVTETHPGGVTALAADRARHIVVTTGRDGTARVWSLPDLRLLRVLRPPLGSHLAVPIAVTPDGSIAAAAAGKYVLLFDVTTGQIVRLIPVPSTNSLENHAQDSAINALAISPDGQEIAIGRGLNDDGCWLYVVRLDGSEIAHQCRVAPEGSVADEFTFSIAFAPDGHLAVATSGGGSNRLTLLTAKGKVAKTVPVPSWIWFGGLAFSPDGQRLAVAYWTKGSRKLELRSGSTLAVIGSPDVRGFSVLMPTLCWINGGATLVASGVYPEQAQIEYGDRTPIYAWDDNGSGARRKAFYGKFLQGPIIDLPDDSLLTVGNRGDLIVTDKTGAILNTKYPDGADFGAYGSQTSEDDRLRLRVSEDGSQIELVTYDQPKRWLHIDARQLTVARIAGPQPGLNDWTISGVHFERGGGLTRYWRLNGRDLKPGEDDENQPPLTSVAAGRVVTVNPSVLFPGIYAFDLLGKPLWVVQQDELTVGRVSRINQSADGRLVVVASSDGSIKWYVGATGKLILTLFVGRTADRWIFFTPSGYYFANPGADKFVGWLIDRGSLQGPDFFSVGQFFREFYKPEVVERVLDTLDEMEAVKQAQVRKVATPLAGDLPPLVAIVSPHDGNRIAAATIPVEYTLRSPSGRPISEILVLINGKRVPLDAPLPAATGHDESVQGRIAVPVPPGQTITLSILATTDTGRHGPASTVKLLAADQANASTPVRRLFALIVGAQTYAGLPQEWRKLRYTAQDARSVAELLGGNRQRRIYDDVEIRLLADGGGAAPTRDAILNGLDWLRREAVRPDDVVLLFISSHGQALGGLSILPTDADPSNLKGTAIAGEKIIDALKGIPGNVLLMIDACYAGAAGRDMNSFVASASSPWAGMFVFASSSANELSQEDSLYGHGRFTQALLEALHGQNGMKTPDGVILTDYLASYLARRIPELGRLDSHQTPLFSGPLYAPDLRAFAVVN